MKKIVILLAMVMVLGSLIATSQSKSIPDGFIGLKWGHSLDKMREEMLLYSVKIDDKNPDKAMAIVDLKRFNPFPDLRINGIALSFYKDKLYSGTIIVKNPKDWDFLSKTIKEKYGDPSAEDMKNVYGNKIGIILKWDFGIGIGIITSRFNQAKGEGTISYNFPPKELIDEFSSQEKEDRSKAKDKL
jgi:hypothetical protein